MKENSIWQKSHKRKASTSLDKDINTSVAIVGGGITGILCSYILKERGIDSVIIESEEVGSGATAYTTGKITPFHSIIYSKLIGDYGEEKAQMYLNANLAAYQKYKNIIVGNSIDCDFEEKPSIIYTLSNKERIENEAAALARLGIESEIVTKTDLPFDIMCGVKCGYSAQFHILKFIDQISKGLKIFEHTKAINIKGNRVITDKGTITARKIIIATHFPIKDIPAFYFAKVTQNRTYMMALKNPKPLEAMYIDEDFHGMTFRSWSDYLIMGGMAHPTGFPDDNAFERLEDRGRALFPDSPAELLWSSQDCMTLDSIPYIGKYSILTPDIFVATGFNKWGITTAMVAAMALSDRITNVPNPNAAVFTSTRFNLMKTTGKMMKNFSTYVIGMYTRLFVGGKSSLDDVKKGQGKIVNVDGKKVCAYCDDNGKYHFVSARCSHMGCQLHFNSSSKSWDCPCHGSRFDVDGNVISGPACKSIKVEINSKK